MLMIDFKKLWEVVDKYAVEDDMRKAAGLARKLFDGKGLRYLVSKLPKIDAEPVRHGEWAKDYDCGAIVYVCSLCGEHYWTEYEHDKKPNYCPNCGARMDLEAEHGTDEH